MADKFEVVGTDVSAWQGADLDFKFLKKKGIKFVILRAGFGDGIKDKQFENYYKKAKAAGMHVGAYWYSYATSVKGAKAEAKSCLEILKGKQFEYPIYFDLEDKTQVGLSKSVKTDMVVAFCEVLEEAGYFAGLYSNLNWLRNELTYDKIKSYTIWLAQWTSKPTYENPFAVWQYGLDKYTGLEIDGDICYEDFPTIIKNAGLNGFPKPEITENPVSDSEASKKPVTQQVVDDVMAGKYGNAPERAANLEKEGYDYKEVQSAVNKYVESLNKTTTLKVGDRVKIKSGSLWTTGGKVPSWVTLQRLYVRSAVTDGTCLVSTLSTGAITGRAYVKDLVKD